MNNQEQYDPIIDQYRQLLADLPGVVILTAKGVEPWMLGCDVPQAGRILIDAPWDKDGNPDLLADPITRFIFPDGTWGTTVHGPRRPAGMIHAEMQTLHDQAVDAYREMISRTARRLTSLGVDTTPVQTWLKETSHE